MSNSDGEQAAFDAVRAAPENEDAWDTVEQYAADSQNFEEVGDLYQEILQTDLTPRLAAVLGQRAVQFVEEWYGEDSEVLVRVLERVLALDTGAAWAFQRLTMVHTVAARWDALFQVYDRALESADDERKKTLLDEAANVAKDFASDTTRSIQYMQALLPLTPGDAQLASSLERLLERENRFADLIEFWSGRLKSLRKKQKKKDLQLRIARTYFDKLEQADRALEALRELLALGPAEEGALELLEQVALSESTPEPVRKEALVVLKDQYETAGRSEDVVRTLGLAISLAEGDERIGLHRETGQRLIESAQPEAAFEQFAELLVLDPTARDALQRLRDLSKKLDAHQKFAEVLERAASASPESAPRIALRVEAGDTRFAALDDLPTAIALYQQVIAEDEIDSATALKVARRLSDLLGRAERREERLAILERLAEREPEAADRRSALLQAARVADDLGDPDRALGALDQRLGEVDEDLEALDAKIAILEREARWSPLVDALRVRASGSVPPFRKRADLVHAARIEEDELEEVDRAIATWLTISETYGEESETVDALARLYSTAERWDDCAELLRRAATREADHVASIFGRIGQVHLEKLADPTLAAQALTDALRIKPSHEAAREGLRTLLEDETCREVAVDGLVVAFQASDEWNETIELLEHRLAAAENGPARVAILRETARLHERRSENLESALFCMRRAMALAPEVRDIEADVFRLAEATDRWDIAVEAIRDAVDALGGKAPRSRYLLFWEARLSEQRLGQVEPALLAYSAVHDGDPGRLDAAEGVIRCAAHLGQLDKVAQATVTTIAAHGEFPSNVRDAIEAALGEDGDWDSLTRLLEETLDNTPDLEASVARELELQTGKWHRAYRSDAAAAAASLTRAVSRDDTHLPTLRALADVQREHPDRALFDTLTRLADLAEDDLDPLHEAAEVALAHLEDPDLRRKTTDRLYREAARLWKRHTETKGEKTPADSARWALDRLVEVYDQQGEPGAMVALLADAAHLPVDGDESRELRRRAAKIAAEVGDRARAIVLYRGILDENPDDQDTLAQLADVCEAEGRLPEMMALRQHELSLCEDPDRRLVIRLDLARIVGEMERRGGRVESLMANLEERPGHDESIDALDEVLVAAFRFEELTDILEKQARALEEAGENKRAARLWGRVAELAEVRLSDVERAIAAHSRVVDLAATPTALDSLARLHTDRNEHAAAAQWLERRLNGAEGAERPDVALLLAKAHLGAEQPRRAVAVLEQALREAPDRGELRDMLAEQYRATERWESLAQLLTDAAPHLDGEGLLQASREAAELFAKLGSPERAIPVLERAVELAPKEKDLRARLAEGLRVEGRLDEARQQLNEVIAAYGRRRNADRARVHHQLADVIRAQGDLPGALEELEQARKIDGRNPAILYSLGDLAQDAGELDRAESSFQALRLMVRRGKVSGDDTPGESELLYELSRIARQSGDAEKADQLLESAMETAIADEAEVRRFCRSLLRRSDNELALRAVEARLEQTEDEKETARLNFEAARLLTEALGDPEKGVARALASAEEAPRDAVVLDGVQELAAKTDALPRLVEVLQGVIKAQGSDTELTADLLLRVGEIQERELEDADGARASYERVELLERRRPEVWRALARLAAKRADPTEEIRVLDLLVQEENGALVDDERIDALFRVAEVKLQAGRDDGLSALEAALQGDPRNTDAAKILAPVVSEEHTEGMALFERTARASGDPGLLLVFLGKRARTESVTLAELREGVELARQSSEPATAETLLKRGVDLLEDSDQGLAAAPWIPSELASLRRDAGDLAGAVAWIQRAADATDSEEQAFELRLSGAEMAAADGGDLDVAAATYRALMVRDPMDQRIWGPLLEVYRRQGNEDALNDLSSQTIDGLLDPELRNQVRMVKAEFLLEREGREPDAADVLRAMLDEDPNHQLAAVKLADLFERTGYDEDLAELLGQQLDVARDNQDLDQIRDLTLRLGTILEKVRREDALDVYRRGLDWLPQDRAIASALLANLGDDDDPRERVEVAERVLATEEGENAARLAIELAGRWEELGDPEGIRRALELGYRAFPQDELVRGRLADHYREHQQHDALAAYTVLEAERVADPIVSPALFREAADMYRDVLHDLGRAAEVLAKAREYSPDDLGLLISLARTRSAAGEHEAAIAEVDRAIETADAAPRSELLRVRAEFNRARGDAEAALADLEGAYALDPAAAGELQVALVAQIEASQGDAEVERLHTLRLIAVQGETGALEEARNSLAEWVARAPNDREALLMLRDMDERSGRFEELAETCARLLQLEEGEEQVQTGLKLADAFAQAGMPERARDGLEQVQAAQPHSAVIRDRLRVLYEQIGAHFELGGLLLQDAEATDDEEARYMLLRTAGDHYLRAGDPDSATGPLSAAVELRPDDHAATLLLVDCYIAAERYPEAGQMLETAIANHPRRRSPELSQLQHRMASLARAAGDANLQMQWLNAALESDKTNGHVAAELAELAMGLNEFDVALNALRVVTLNKTEGPMSRAMAFLLQARIAHERGEARRAILWARKARSEDPALHEVEEFLASIGEA
ncbi:MAG: tetratricopeptide repeat protein [Myxococcota bacterium]